MKKAFDSTIDEAVTTQYKLACIVGIVRKQRWMGLIWVPPFFLIFYLILHGTTASRLVLAAVLSLGLVIVHLLTVVPLIKHNIRKNLVKARGTADPVPAEYELADDALIFRRSGHELRFAWQTIVRFEDSPATLDVYTQPTGLAMIPKRICSERRPASRRQYCWTRSR